MRRIITKVNHHVLIESKDAACITDEQGGWGAAGIRIIYDGQGATEREIESLKGTSNISRTIKTYILSQGT